MSQKVLKADHQRETHTAVPSFLNHLHQVDVQTLLLSRHDLDVARSVDTEVARSPTVYVIKRNRGWNVPAVRHDRRKLSGASLIAIGGCKKDKIFQHEPTEETEGYAFDLCCLLFEKLLFCAFWRFLPPFFS